LKLPVNLNLFTTASRQRLFGCTGQLKVSQVGKHIVFTGHVQGVGFRFTAHHIANRYHLTGFVRNLPDGMVEMLAQGTPDDIDSCISQIQNSFAGYMRDSIIEDVPVDARYTEFRITL
jgi:acylphosphatase